MSTIAETIPQYTKPKLIRLKGHPLLKEAWVQQRIAEDPAILGLGDLVLRNKEKIQPTGGRVDLILQDFDDTVRYEVEVQLGPTDPSHIIRTIEYWDVERARHPELEHFAVLIAEDITSRFLNVMSLMNKSVPLVAIQMQAVQVLDHFTLVFTKVLDTAPQDDEEDSTAQPVDRLTWEKQIGTSGLQAADELRAIAQYCDPEFGINYTKSYISIAKGGKIFMSIRPSKEMLVLKIVAPPSEELQTAMEEKGLGVAVYKKRGYYFRVGTNFVLAHADDIRSIVKAAYDRGSW
jgi:hypothetical protein